MKNPKVSVAVATFNEEKNIVACLKSIKQFADEIIVVDGSSEDRTRDLAKNFGAKVTKTTNKKMFHINKNLAIDNCRSEWIFLIDADEMVTKELAGEILKIISNNPKENGYWVNRRNWFLGDYLKKGGAYPDSVIRLFRKGKGKLPEKSVHEQVAIDGKVGYLENDILHMADPNFERYLIRANRYTDLTAQKIKEKDPGRGVVPVVYYMLVKPILTFLNIFIRHKGYLDGFRGFVWALFSAAHYFYAYVKYWEARKKN